MKMRIVLAAFGVCAAAMFGGSMISQAQQVVYEPAPVYAQPSTVVYLQAPVVNIGNRHGNLRSAQGEYRSGLSAY
ncbi:MAG: hypothetical protein WBQ95_11550 [Terracidiphilus sp.]